MNTRHDDELRNELVRGFALALGVAADEAVVRYVTEGRGGLEGRAVELLRWDANSVHGYVFDTGNASVIRGASHVLKSLDAELKTGKRLGLDPAQVLFAGGGGGVAVVAADRVAGLTDALHRLYVRRTQAATCTVASVRLEAEGEHFGQRMAALHWQLARQRARCGADAEAPVPFFAHRCQVCGRRAAATEVRRGLEHRQRKECSPCFERIEAGKGHVQSEQEASDYEELASADGTIGVIYLDGNRIGTTISQLKSPLAYASFSVAIERAMKEAFTRVAERYALVEEGAGGSGQQYQMPIAGGDDRVLIVAGDVAVPLARDFLAAFQRAADSDAFLHGVSGGPIGAAAGIAVGKVKFPIRHLLEEAEALLESAKQRVYADGVRCALDFAVVDDGTPRRASAPAARFAADGSPMLLSGKPYSLEEFVRFSDRRRVICESLATTQLHALRRYAQAGPWQLRNHVLFQIGRHQSWRELACALAENGDPLRDPDAAFDVFVPRDGGGQRTFDVADMIELQRNWREGGASP